MRLRNSLQICLVIIAVISLNLFAFAQTDKPKSNWQKISPVSSQGHSIQIDPNNSKIIYIAQRPEGIYKSTDGGKTFKAINKGIKIKNAVGRGIATNNLLIDPSDTKTLWLGLEWNGVYKSTDAGKTWVEHNNGIKEGLAMNAINFGFHPKDRNTVYIGTDAGAYKTTDGGKSWAFHESLRAKTIMTYQFDPSNTDIIYAAVYVPLANEEAGIWKTVDGGKSWKPMNKGLPESPVGKATLRDNSAFNLLINPNNPKILVAATKSGIYRTTDGGENWTHAKETPVRPIVAMSMVKSKPEVIYGFLWKEGVYKSLDFGATWKLLPNSLQEDFMWRIEADPNNPNLLYGAVNRGTFKLTTDF